MGDDHLRPGPHGLDRDWQDPDPLRPQHYGGEDDPYETIKVLRAWGLATPEALLFNVVKYVSRAGKKGDRLEDLRKAQVYLGWAIEQLERGGSSSGPSDAEIVQSLIGT